MTAAMLSYLYKAWIKPRRAAHIREHYLFEPGPDYAVSHREMIVRSAWRYDSWTDRIMSLLGFAIMAVAWFAVLFSH